MSAESADNKLAMTFQSTPPVGNGSGNVEEEPAEKGNPQTDVNGDANMTGMAITYPALYDMTVGNKPSAGGVTDPNPTLPTPQSSAPDSGAIPSHNGRKYNKSQRHDVNRVL